MQNTTHTLTGLPIDEEQALIREAQDGDEAAMTNLISAYTPAIKNAARKFAVEDTYREDAEQEATLAFIEAVKSHDFARADRLSTYIAAALRNHLTDAMTDNASAWGIPARTTRLFYRILRLADGDILAGADLAGDYEMERGTFLGIAALLHTGSMTEGEGEAPVAERANPVGAETRDPYADLDRMMLCHSLMEAIPDTASLDIVRRAYGFDPVVVDGTVIDPVVSDGTLAQTMPYPTEKGTAWTRPTVQRRRVAALTAMREKYELTTASEED